jgi:hypothetical protein
MRIVCTGGRDFKNYEIVYSTLEILSPHFVYVGCCPTGVDKYVREWCASQKDRDHINGTTTFDSAVFKADWDGLGRPAGPIRNSKMCAAAAKAGCKLLLAFPGNKGTNDCIRHGKSHGMTILRVEV